jgi:PAS domain S-box-containing protein
MSAPNPTTTAARERSYFHRWTWVAVVFSIGVCLAMSWLHVQERKTISRAEHILENLREARIDLSKGFLHVLLAGNPDSPFRREQGMALILQSISSLRRADHWPAGSGSVTDAEGTLTRPEFEAQVQRFLDLLADWNNTGSATGNPPHLELRVAYHQIEREAERIDLANRRDFQNLSAQLDRRFAITLVAAIILLGGFCIGVYVAGVNEKAAIQALQASEAQLRLVGDNLPDSYIYQFHRDDEGKPHFTFVSAGVQAVHGISVTDVLANGHLLTGQIDAEQRARIEARERDSAANMSDFGAEIRFHRPDGETRTIHLGSRPTRLPSGRVQWNGCATDISHRERAESALRQQLELQNQLSRVASTVPGMIYTFLLRTDGSMAMPFASAAVETVFGIRPEEVRNDATPILSLVHADDAPRVIDTIRASARTLTPWREEFRARNAKQGTIWVEGHSVPQPQNDGSVLWYGFLQDITPRKQLEAQFRQAQKMEAIGLLAGGVAHDFNNILAAIMMQAELCDLYDDLPQEVRTGLHQITTAAKRAAALTSQLLLFSRRQVMQPRSLDLNETVNGLAKMLQRIIGEDVRLHLHLHPTPLIAQADPGMLDQVLLNLAVNARDAMPKGGRLTIETYPQRLDPADPRLPSDSTPGNYAVLQVTDAGCGIPPEIMPRIFDPFFTTKEPGKGTGLGLATVFGIVKQHHGFIQVDSEPGRGTQFRIFVPASTPAQPPLSSPAAPPRPRGGTETILLVEDDAALRTVTRITLERHGYRVIEAASGVEALPIAENHQGQLQLLLTDLVMPGGLSGHDLSRKLLPDHPGLKVIYISGYSPDIAGRELDLRPDEAFIQKPCAPDQLLGKIRHVLDS